MSPGRFRDGHGIPRNTSQEDFTSNSNLRAFCSIKVSTGGCAWCGVIRMVTLHLSLSLPENDSSGGNQISKNTLNLGIFCTCLHIINLA